MVTRTWFGLTATTANRIQVLQSIYQLSLFAANFDVSLSQFFL